MIGMSALLTTTMEEQKKVIKRVRDEGLPYKCVVGGAPATQRWADQIGADAYAEDANDGVKKIDASCSGSERAARSAEGRGAPASAPAPLLVLRSAAPSRAAACASVRMPLARAAVRPAAHGPAPRPRSS